MLFVDFSQLLELKIVVHSSEGSIGFVNIAALNQRQIDELRKCAKANVRLSELSQDLRVAVIAQAIKSEILEIEVAIIETSSP